MSHNRRVSNCGAPTDKTFICACFVLRVPNGSVGDNVAGVGWTARNHVPCHVQLTECRRNHWRNMSARRACCQSVSCFVNEGSSNECTHGTCEACHCAEVVVPNLGSTCCGEPCHTGGIRWNSTAGINPVIARGHPGPGAWWKARYSWRMYRTIVCLQRDPPVRHSSRHRQVGPCT